MAREAWDELFDNTDHLLLGSRKTSVDLSALQPEPVHIFRLWQTYLDNVNPLLKVTHTPSLQPRIIQAMGNMADISPSLEALMFSIYCISILTIPAEECQALFGSPKGDLVMRYQFGAQQALANCGYLRTSDRICLTALYLYLVCLSVIPLTFTYQTRSLSAPVQTLDHCPPYLALRFALRDVWGSTTKWTMQNALLSRPKCVEDSGGHSSFSIPESANLQITKARASLPSGTADFL